MDKKHSPINTIWFAMMLLALTVGAARGTLDEVNASIFSSARSAVDLALGLIGPMAFWLGIMSVAEKAGLMQKLAHLLRPLLRHLFPAIPEDHPALGAIIMNISANMLGLGNAATPMGIKAMIELQKLNPDKKVATNEMILFLAINTSSVTLLPLGVITVRAAAGSSNPASIILPSMLATTLSTTAAIIASKLLQSKDSDKAVPLQNEDDVLEEVKVEAANPTTKPGFMGTLLPLLFGCGVIYYLWSNRTDQLISQETFTLLTTLVIPLIIAGLLTYGYRAGLPIYETVTEGAKEGFNTAIRIIPFMVAIIVAIGVVRSSGLLDITSSLLSPVTSLLRVPVEIISLALMRPLSGSGSFAMMTEFVSQSPDSFLADLASTMQGSTETTFYVLAVYFGAIGVTKSRHALPAALLADLTGFFAAVFFTHLLLG